jgi:hypothetical protein
MREIRTGVWHWQAPHAEWSSNAPWGENVSSYGIDEGERLLLFDPIAPPSEIVELARERETAIVLTAPWHERDTKSLVEQLGLPVFTPRPDSAQDLMEMYGITAEQAGDGSPDLAWLFKEGKGEARPYVAGDRLPVGVQAFPGQKRNDLVLLGREPQRGHRRRHARRLWERPRDQPQVAEQGGHDARTGRRRLAYVARPARGTHARDARRAV